MEALDFFRVERAELPASRVTRENLENVALLRERRVYCLIKRISDGDVDPDLDRKASLVYGAAVV